MRRIPIRFTRFGTSYTLFSLAVGAAAINTGNNLLYLMLGLLLGFIIISGFLSDSSLWGVRTDFRPAGDFYVGQKAEWDVIAHKKGFPGILLEIQLFWKEENISPSRCFFYWVSKSEQEPQRISLVPSRRGYWDLEKVRYATRFPFGLFEKSHFHSRAERWVVFPKVELLSAAVLRAGGLNTADQPAGRRGPGATPFDLREFKAGDSSKRIHWKSSAKRGHWMISEMEEESALSQAIYVSHWPEQCESFIAFTASLVYTLHRQGLPVALHTPGVHFPADHSNDHLKRILTYLALVDPNTEKGALPHSPSQGINVVNLWERRAA